MKIIEKLQTVIQRRRLKSWINKMRKDPMKKHGAIPNSVKKLLDQIVVPEPIKRKMVLAPKGSFPWEDAERWNWQIDSHPCGTPTVPKTSRKKALKIPSIWYMDEENVYPRSSRQPAFVYDSPLTSASSSCTSVVEDCQEYWPLTTQYDSGIVCDANVTIQAAPKGNTDTRDCIKSTALFSDITRTTDSFSQLSIITLNESIQSLDSYFNTHDFQEVTLHEINSESQIEEENRFLKPRLDIMDLEVQTFNRRPIMKPKICWNGIEELSSAQSNVQLHCCTASEIPTASTSLKKDKKGCMFNIKRFLRLKRYSSSCRVSPL